MIIDLILDRRDDEARGVNSYDAADFYRSVVRYGEIGHDITRAMDYGTEDDVRRELCAYVIEQDYNPEICDFINARAWLKAGPRLAGKYAKLRDDLRAAFAETEELEQTEDGGTCNFDAPVVYLPRWRGKDVEQAAKEAGGGAWKWRGGGYCISFRGSGQGNRRTRRAEAIREALAARGYETAMYYAMD